MQSKHATTPFHNQHKAFAVTLTSAALLAAGLVSVPHTALANDTPVPLSVILNGNGGVLSSKSLSGLNSTLPTNSIADAERPGYRLIGFSGTALSGNNVTPAMTPGEGLWRVLNRLGYTVPIAQDRLSSYSIAELQSAAEYLSLLYDRTGGTGDAYTGDWLYREFHSYLQNDSRWSVNVADGAKETLEFRIVGINHDVLADGSERRAGLTLMMTHGLAAGYKLDSNSQGYTGWWDSELYARCGNNDSTSDSNVGDVWEILPVKLREAARTVTKDTLLGNSGGTTMHSSADRLWVPSAREVYGESWAYAEGSQYEFFGRMLHDSATESYENLVPLTKPVSGDARYTLLRSPHPSTAYYPQFIDLDGSLRRNYGACGASYPYGIVLGLSL